jgi:nucleotide-binding universal stress UspA family protein
MFKRIVAALDGSSCAAHAFDVALALAKSEGAKVAVCSVVDPMPMFGSPPGSAGAALTAAESYAQHVIDGAVAKLESAGIAHETKLILGEPAYEIARYAADVTADAIVIGTRGRSGLKRMFAGSVAEGVLRSASVPVVIVREAAQIAAFNVSAAS